MLFSAGGGCGGFLSSGNHPRKAAALLSLAPRVPVAPMYTAAGRQTLIFLEGVGKVWLVRFPKLVHN